MAYVTGTAANIAALRAAIADTLVANLWTADGAIVKKGSIAAELVTMTDHVRLICGTGSTAGVLDGRPVPLADGKDRFVSLAPIGAQNFQWPVTYFIHVNTAPDEVVVVVRDQVDRYSYIAFGHSPLANSPTQGQWYAGSCSASVDRQDNHAIDYSTSGFSGKIRTAVMFAMHRPNGNTQQHTQSQQSFVRHGLDGNTWSCEGDAIGSVSGTTQAFNLTPSRANAFIPVTEMLKKSPNPWNGEATLLPILPMVFRASDFTSIVAQLEHVRYVRVDFLQPEQVLTYGPDKWRVYPFVRKDTTERDGLPTQSITHSGTFGFAVRYDGP